MLYKKILYLIPLLSIIIITSCSNDNNLYDNLESDSEEVIEDSYGDLSLEDAQDIISNEKIELAGGGPMELVKREFFELDKKNEFYKKYNKCTDFTAVVGEDAGSDLISETYLYLKEPDFDKKERFELSVLFKQRTYTSNEDNLKFIKKVSNESDCLVEPFSIIMKNIAKNFNSKLDKTSVEIIKGVENKSNLLLKFSSKLYDFKEKRLGDDAVINFYYLLVDEYDYFSEYYLVFINNDNEEDNIEKLLKIANTK